MPGNRCGKRAEENVAVNGMASRCRRNAAFVGTFRAGIRIRAGERGFLGGSAYNGIEKVVEKRRFLRHLPVNRKQEYRREGAVKVLHQKSWRAGAGEMPLLSAPSGQGSGSGPAREVSWVGRLITESRRWWRKGAFSVTFQSTKIRITDGKEVVKRAEKKKSGQPCMWARHTRRQDI